MFTGSANYYGTNYLIDDPEFVDPAQNDFHLQATSPCIDAGSNTLAPIVDFDQVSRPQGPIVDIGPYEYVIDSPICTLTLTVSGSGVGTIEVSPSGPYQVGDHVTIWANASTDSVFSQFTGDLSGSQNPQILTMNEDKTVNAEFTMIIPSFTLNVDVEGNGIVDVYPNQQLYQQGDNIELTATAKDGWVFDHWEEELTGTENPKSIIILKDTRIKAVFSEILFPHIVTILDIQPADGSIDVPIDQSYLQVTFQNNKQTPINYIVTTQPDIGSTQGSIISGTITLPITYLEYYTHYLWTIQYETEDGWKTTNFDFTSEEQPEDPLVEGDMNGDGVFNVADVRYLALYLTGDPQYETLYAEGDVNCQGSINPADVRYLALYLAGHPSFQPLYPSC